MDRRPTADDVVPGTKADLDQVMGWLEREFEAGENDFWYNKGLLSKALDYEEFYVMRDGGEAVAFHVGQYAPSIANVRKDKQGQGFGTALLEAAVARAERDGVNVLDVECAPRSSLTFWEKHGFERYGDMSDWGKVTARRILHRSFDLPPERPRVPVTVEFYPERATYGRCEAVEPLAVHNVSGAYLDNGALMLERRVIGVDDGPGDLAIRIIVDGEQRCLCKAKYPEAEKAGVVWDRRGGAFYLDAIYPRGT